VFSLLRAAINRSSPDGVAELVELDGPGFTPLSWTFVRATWAYNQRGNGRKTIVKGVKS